MCPIRFFGLSRSSCVNVRVCSNCPLCWLEFEIFSWHCECWAVYYFSTTSGIRIFEFAFSYRVRFSQHTQWPPSPPPPPPLVCWLYSSESSAVVPNSIIIWNLFILAPYTVYFTVNMVTASECSLYLQTNYSHKLTQTHTHTHTQFQAHSLCLSVWLLLLWTRMSVSD